jgi:hypothetical protein
MLLMLGSWDGYAQRLMSDTELQQIKEEIEDKSMAYPSYYLKPFHACECKQRSPYAPRCY